MPDRNNSENLQNDFFNRARREKSRVAVFLNGGKKLSGRIKGFDRFTIILDGPGGEQMIFKHAIATVSCTKTFSNYMEFDGAEKKRNRPGSGESEPQPDAATRSGPTAEKTPE